jgi:hypothetical protein
MDLPLFLPWSLHCDANGWWWFMTWMSAQRPRMVVCMGLLQQAPCQRWWLCPLVGWRARGVAADGSGTLPLICSIDAEIRI